MKKQLIKYVSGIILIIALLALPFLPIVKSYLTIPTEVNIYTNSTETFQISTSDEEVEAFDIEIISAIEQINPATKGMVIKVTDKRLLDKTGGIVQGMSGSPIIQDNKIVGAVTHVFVNDPTSGYGIHIEWMLEEADINYKESFAKAG